jgi:hypothetical protein
VGGGFKESRCSIRSNSLCLGDDIQLQGVVMCGQFISNTIPQKASLPLEGKKPIDYNATNQ